VSNKPWTSKVAKKLQHLAEDELGKRPALMTCHNIVRNDLEASRRPGEQGVRAEEFAARLFELRRDVLVASAERKVVLDMERQEERKKEQVP